VVGIACFLSLSVYYLRKEKRLAPVRFLISARPKPRDEGEEQEAENKKHGNQTASQADCKGKA
jgi:hypothetical protein